MGEAEDLGAGGEQPSETSSARSPHHDEEVDDAPPEEPLADGESARPRAEAQRRGGAAGEIGDRDGEIGPGPSPSAR